MNPLDDKPVIVGSAMSGLIVSRALAEAGIDHVMLGGDPPDDTPRLGESLNECAGPAMWRWFGKKYPECFFTKSHISMMNGRHMSLVSTGNPQRNLAGLQRFATTKRKIRLSYFTRGTILHVDRIGLDQGVYQDAISDPHCTFVKSLASDIEYDSASDKITKLTLEDGTVINRPRYVFDATGFRGVVAKAAGVGMRATSNLQRVVWTHFYREDDGMCDPCKTMAWWRHGTNLLRLTREHDGVSAISWLIPLGNTLSVGVSFDADDPAIESLDKQQLLDLLTAAYQRRGIDYTIDFPHVKPVQELKHKYYVRDRAYGGNWLLVGGTFITIWFPTSAGLWTVSAAAGLAPNLIEEPLRFGAKYEQSMSTELGLHDHMEKMIHGDLFASQRDVYDFWHGWEKDIPRRAYALMRIANGDHDVWTPRYRVIAAFAAAIQNCHNLLFLLPITNRVRSPRPIPDLSRQVNAFPHYFHPRRFSAERYLTGLWNATKFLLTRRKRPASSSATTQPAAEQPRMEQESMPRQEEHRQEVSQAR